MNQSTSRFLHACLAIAAAFAATLLAVVLMVLLNRKLAVAAPESGAIRCTMIEGQHHPDRPTRETPDDKPVETPNEIMTVDLDAPMPDMPEVAPLDLNLAIASPSVEAVRIAVAPKRIGASSPTAAAASTTPTKDAVYDSHRVDQAPREISATKPRYPDRESQLGIEGTVMMEILIDERGRVADVRFLSGAESFRRAVMEVVHTWRYEPARHEGRVVKVWGKKPVNFNHPRNRS
jgi:TonB family protein